MEQNCLAGTQKSGLRSRTLYRVAAVGIATLITQASPGGAASSWGVECLTTDLDNNSYCVTSLIDDIPSDSAAWTLRTNEATWTLRKSVDEANTRAAVSATIGFQDALFSAATSSDNAKLVLNSTLEIKTNVTITAPTDSGGSPLLTIVRGDGVASGAPLIAINPTADAHPATLTTGPAANQATEEVRIENVNIQARANTENPQGSGFADQTQEFANPGVTIQVKETISVTSTGPDVVAPAVVLVNTTISNAVSESGGAAVNTPGNVRIEGSTLVGNVAITPSGGAPTDGGAIKAEGTVTVVSSALNNNSATGNGGAISATTVIVENAPNLQNSQLIGNTAGGSGGAISTEGNVSVSRSTLAGNSATAGSGGAISTSGVSSTVAVTNSGLVNNTAGGDGGAISTTGVSSTVAVTNSGLGNNTAGGDGGAISASGTTGAVSVTNSSLGVNTASGDGGAIAAGGAVTVSSSSVLVSNSATSGNGGAIAAGGDVTIANSGLGNNTAGGNGGAISVTGATSAVEVTNSGLGSNTAGGSGGAISVTGATSAVEVTNSVLAFNIATSGNGGAIATTGASSTVSVTNSGLGYNAATTGNGGAIATTGASSAVQITDSSIAENRAGQNGGGISSAGQVTIGSTSPTPTPTPTTGNSESALSASTTSEVTESTFSASTSISLTLGSNVYGASAGQGDNGSSDITTNPSGSIMFRNTAVSGNGGAVSAQGEVAVTSGSNIYANTARQDGGAISSQSAVEISNSAVSGNTAITGDGGAISAGGQVTVSSSNLNSNEAIEGSGGAIAATTSVVISDTEFIDNSASDFGGAIDIGDDSNEKSSIIDSTFVENSSYESGGAINGHKGKLVVNNTEFTGNTAAESGGAIWHQGDLDIIDSTFTGNVASVDSQTIHEARTYCDASSLSSDDFDPIFRLECFIEISFYSDYSIPASQGGAIFVSNDLGNEGNSPELKVSFNNTDFYQNSAQGDGGAIYFLGLLQILGSRFEENWALPGELWINESLSEFQGSGGAIYGKSVEVISSEFEGNYAIHDGGALHLDEQTVITNSIFDSNAALFGSGGAIYANGTLNVSNSTFGSTPGINPNYNPIIGYNQNPGYSPNPTIENPNFNPYVEVINPAYNPIGMVTNPTYNIEVSKFINNPNYNISVLRQIPNAECPTGSTIYNGEDFGNGPIYGCEYTINNGDGSISFGLLPLYVDNPDYDDRLSLDNPLYDDRQSVPGLLKPELPENNSQFISVLSNPDQLNDEEEFISNPNQDTREELPQLRNTDMPQDDNKFIYRGNVSGSDGGAIYLEGEATIKDSSFAGNTSGDDGGAIYSEGTLDVKDSIFNRNWAEDDGGAIKTTPGSGDLFITRTSFTENVSMDDGGAIYISTGSVEHYDDVILSSLFRGNEAFGTGGAVDSGYVVLILNTFEDNNSLDGQSLNLSGGYLSGNVLIGDTNGQDLCFVSGNVIAANNFGTDESCFVSNNYLLTRVEITEEGALHTLPAGYESTLLGELKGNEEFYLENPSENNLNGVLAPLGTFITNELNKDFNSEIRDSEVFWTAGHLQGIFPDLPLGPEVDNSGGDKEIVKPKDQEQNSESNNQVLVNQPGSTNQSSPVLILEPTLSAEELARISQLRAEQLAAEMLRQKEVDRIAADNLARIKAAKLARDKARALAAEKRRAQLAALKAKIAATHARGVALKQKPSWINLMKNSSNSNSAKGLVRVPIK